MTERMYAEVAEGVRATLATYTQALDDGRTDDVVATFCRGRRDRHSGDGHPHGSRRPPEGVQQRGRRGGHSGISC